VSSNERCNRAAEAVVAEQHNPRRAERVTPLAERPPGSGRDKAGRLTIPDEVEELRLSLDRVRLIRVVGWDRDGQAVERHLKVTAKGKLALM